MSLVNDMLRDLDTRRRDTPARGIGAEKLVPAGEQSAGPARRTTALWLWLALPVLVAASVLVYLLVDRDSGQLPSVVLSQPVESPPLSEAPARNAPVAERSTFDEAMGIELAEMSVRLHELETQNQALLRAQQNQASSSSGASSSGSQQAAGGSSEQIAWQPREWTPQVAAEPADVTADDPATRQSAQADVVQQPSTDTAARVADSSAQQPGSTVRSPRELSFAETDRLRVQQALEQWNGGQQLAALQSLDTFIYDFPEAHQSREMLAKLLIQQGEPGRAMQVVDLGLTIAPRRNGYKKVKARLLLTQGQAAEAVALLSSGRPSVADDVEYHDLLATGLLSSAAYEEAAVSYQALLETDKGSGRWWYGLAASLDAQGRSRDAAQAYEQALRREDLSTALRQGSQQRLQAIRQALP